MQTLTAALFVAVLLATSASAAPPAEPATDRGRLAEECDALVRDAVKTPYGWGWNAGRRRAPVVNRSGRGPQVTTFDVRATAAAGLALHLAGAQLAEPRFTAAALQAARSVVAVQANTGQVPATGVIRANAGGRDGPLAVPSRAATCAALGLLLTILHDGGEEAARYRPAAVRAAHWLASTQTRGEFAGGWVVAFPRDAAPGQGTRLIRLDDAEYRDASLALWLAGPVLGDERLLAKARLAVEHLVSLRIADEKGAGRNLWQTAYTPDGETLTTVPELPPMIDAVASRNAMQALLGACLAGDAETTTPVLREAAASLEKLPKEKGTWRRRYDLDVELPGPQAARPDPAPPAEEPEPPVSSLFGTAGDGESERVSGVDEIVRAVGRLTEVGPEQYLQSLSATLPVQHRLALVVCGLCDDAVSAEQPPEAGSTSEDVSARAPRIAALAWRVRIRQAKRAGE